MKVQVLLRSTDVPASRDENTALRLSSVPDFSHLTGLWWHGYHFYLELVDRTFHTPICHLRIFFGWSICSGILSIQKIHLFIFPLLSLKSSLGKRSPITWVSLASIFSLSGVHHLFSQQFSEQMCFLLKRFWYFIECASGAVSKMATNRLKIISQFPSFAFWQSYIVRCTFSVGPVSWYPANYLISSFPFLPSLWHVKIHLDLTSPPATWLNLYCE